MGEHHEKLPFLDNLSVVVQTNQSTRLTETATTAASGIISSALNSSCYQAIACYDVCFKHTKLDLTFFQISLMFVLANGQIWKLLHGFIFGIELKICKIMKIYPSMIPAGIYLFQAHNGNTRTMCEICLKLTIKTPEQRRRRSGVFIVKCEQNSHMVLVFPLLTSKK